MRLSLCLAIWFVIASPSAGQELADGFTVIDMGTLRVGTETIPRAINDEGTVVGTATSRDDGRPTAFVWTERSGFRVLFENATAADINNAGTVIGTRRECENSCPERGYIWTAAGDRTDLDDFSPVRLNERGDIAGICDREGAMPQACVLIDGVLSRIGPSPYGGFALDINESGVVAGFAYRPVAGGGLAPYAFKWSAADGIRLLRDRDADTSSAHALNDGGVIAGDVAYNGANSRVQAAVWLTTSPTIAGGAHWSSANAINMRRQSAGTIWVAGRAHPAVWIPGWPVQRLPVPAGLDGWMASDINEAGFIVGTAYRTAGHPAAHGILWVPRSTGLYIDTPNTVSRWGHRTRQRLAWTYDGDAPQFLIEVSYNGGRLWDYVETVENKPGPSQNFHWTVTGRTSSQARFRVAAIGDKTATDVNDANIQIGPRFIEVLAPRSSANVGSRQEVFWKHNLGAGVPVIIEVSRDGGGSWHYLANTVTVGAETSSFLWSVDVPPTRRGRIRVRASDGQGGRGTSAIFPVIAR